MYRQADTRQSMSETRWKIAPSVAEGTSRKSFDHCEERECRHHLPWSIRGVPWLRVVNPIGMHTTGFVVSWIPARSGEHNVHKEDRNVTLLRPCSPCSTILVTVRQAKWHSETIARDASTRSSSWTRNEISTRFRSGFASVKKEKRRLCHSVCKAWQICSIREELLNLLNIIIYAT